MRTGAIFARGSCRALKWMALLGVTLTLGVGQAFAQGTQLLEIESLEIKAATGGKVDEGQDTMIVVTLEEAVKAGKAADGTDAGDTAVTVTLTFGGLDGGTTTGNAEPEDLRSGSTNITNGGTLTGTIAEGKKTLELPLRVRTDDDAQDEKFTIAAVLTDPPANPGANTGDGFQVSADEDITPEEFTIVDTDTQKFVFDIETAAADRKEGATINVALMASPPISANETVTVTLDIGGDDRDRYEFVSLAGVTPTTTSLPTLAFTSTDGEFKFGVALRARYGSNDGDRSDDLIALMAYEDREMVGESDAITVKDIHGLPATAAITVKAYDKMSGGEVVTELAEGDTVYLEVEVDRGTTGYPMDEKLDVELELSGASSGATLEKDMVEIAAGTGEKKSDRVKLDVMADDRLGGGTLTITPVASGADEDNGSGSETGTPLMLTIGDETEPRIEARDEDDVLDAVEDALDDGKGDDDYWSPTEMLELELSDLFMGYGENNVTLNAVSSDSSKVGAFTSGDDIRVTAVALGMATITVTARVDPVDDTTASSAAPTIEIPTQTSANTATVKFTVTVEASLPGTPEAPEVVATGRNIDGSNWGLRASWDAPDNNDGEALTYMLRYRLAGTSWSSSSGSGFCRAAGLFTGIEGLSSSFCVSQAGEYEVQIAATNTVGDSPWSEMGSAETGQAQVAGAKGQILKMEMKTGVPDRSTAIPTTTIGGMKRVHVMEGANDVVLAVTVRWTHKELAALIAENEKTQAVGIAITGGYGATNHALPSWLSWRDGEGDADFPEGTWSEGLRWTYIQVPVPKAPSDFLDESDRHYVEGTKEIRILLPEDDHEAENDAFYIEAYRSADVDLAAGDSANRITPLVVIEDNDPQKVTVKKGTSSGPSSFYEGDKAEFTIAADPPRNELPLEVRLDMLDLSGVSVSSAEISLSTGTVRLNDGGTGNSTTVTINSPASDGDRVDADYELQASVNVYSLSSGGYETIAVAEHPITVLDVHKLPELTVTQTAATVKEGEKIELTLMINRNPANTTVSTTEKLQYTQEEVSIMLTMGAGSTAGASDFSVVTNPVTFAKRTRGSYTETKTVEVMATADGEIDDMEMLVLDAMIAGAETKNGTDKATHAAVASLTIEDGTGKLVWAKTQEEVEAAIYAAKSAGMGDDMTFAAGEMIEVTGSDVFGYGEGVTVSYSAMTSDEKVASTSVNGGMVMVTAKGMGMADITITAHGNMPSGVKILDQSDPGEASITFPVEVGLEALSIVLTGPEDMNLVEGGMGAMVTATANRAVTEDTMVMLMRDRSMSSAGDEDYTAEAISIKAGAMTGTTMVMAVEDNMMESVDNMPEELVLYGMTEGMAGEVTGEVKLYLWDAAVPALPIIAQLLLAVFLAAGGYRRYRRR